MTFDPALLPEFFIVGAQKAGTTTLHHMVRDHPDIFIPDNELFFFDVDDLTEHPDFFQDAGRRWHHVDFETQLEELLPWYLDQFRSAAPHQRRGDHSTTYLSAIDAPARIAGMRPDGRVIVLLRDPVERTYSHYWHLLRHHAALLSFEDSLRYWPDLLLRRSVYLPLVQRYLAHFPREQVKIVLFEDLVAEPGKVLDDVLGFLGVDPAATPAVAARRHSNRGSAPRSVPLALMQNRLQWRQSDTWTEANQSHRAPGVAPTWPVWRRRLRRATRRLEQVVNPNSATIPPMRADIRAFLSEYLRRQNAGLDELVGRALGEVWYDRLPEVGADTASA